jgi:hypothetical protein
MDIKTEFSTDIAKKIFGNKENASKFLVELAVIKNLVLPFKKISKGINKDKKVLKLTTKELWDKIVTYWDFSNGESIIRELFKETKKYESGKDSYSTMEVLINEWTNLSLGDISWPFSQGDFDGFVQRLNSENTTGSYKDEKVKQAAVKYRRIKEINTVRNDFLETLIFDKNENILPTLNHRKGVDFFINGVSFDQKVSRSPTKEFKKYYGENWKEEAIKNPSKVAEYLYMYQDEGRFGADSRLLVVYLDEDVSISKISEIIQNIDLNNPIEINFEYIHNKNKPNELKKIYKVNCFVILLHNEVKY